MSTIGGGGAEVLLAQEVNPEASTTAAMARNAYFILSVR